MNPPDPANANPDARLVRIVGVVLDVLLIFAAVGTMLKIFAGPVDAPGNHVRNVAIGMSLAGPLIAVRRLLMGIRPLPRGIKLWGWHGVMSAVAFAVVAVIVVTVSDNLAVFVYLMLTCLAAMFAQCIVTIIAIVQFIRRRAKTVGDLVATAVCVAYAVMIAYWLLFVWK